MQSSFPEKMQSSVVTAMCLLCILLLANISILLALIHLETKDRSVTSVNKFWPEFCIQKNTTALDVSFIEGGQVAGKTQLPWNVALRSGAGLCSGSLISPQWVISAAHCKGEQFSLSLGHVNMKDPGIIYREAIKTIRHEHYEAPKLDMLKNPKKDIMLMKLNARVIYNDHVQPIRLPAKGYQFLESDLCIMSGWGAQRKTSKTTSKSLKYICARPVHIDRCSEIHNMELTNEEICYNTTVRENPYQAACSGDSGGSVSCWVDDQWQLAGIISWGEICDTKNKMISPGVGTNVAAFRDWVDFTIKH